MPLIVALLLGGMAAARRAPTGGDSPAACACVGAGLGLATILAVLWTQFYRTTPPWTCAGSAPWAWP